jgi:phosphoribosylglycinamide formyltransferase 1
MQALVQAIQNGSVPAEPACVISNIADAGGIARAGALGIPVALVPHQGRSRTDFESALHQTLTESQADLVCLAGFMRILSPGFVQKWPKKILNIHPSLLPKYPGLHTHQRALESCDQEHGATVHFVTEGLDSGPVIGQVRIPILPADTAESLAARLLPHEHRLYAESLRCVLNGTSLPFTLDS